LEKAKHLLAHSERRSRGKTAAAAADKGATVNPIFPTLSITKFITLIRGSLPDEAVGYLVSHKLLLEGSTANEM
jgi:hypothetical protein